MKKTLYELKTERIWIKIDVYDTPDGRIVVHGHDSGKTVQELMDNYDYEYFIEIKKEAVQDLTEKLSAKKEGNTIEGVVQNLIEKLSSKRKKKTIEDVINWFAKHFSHHEAIFEIKEELKDMDVDFTFSTWR